ncbi:unnamed protein product [Symbiodinium sp. CCMP2456]|nr:unnamed protein product [Symbiodinium sp. CCMP2456]
MFAVLLLLQALHSASSVGLDSSSPPQAEALLQDDECQSPSSSESAQCALNALQIERTASEEAGTQEAEYNSTSQRWVLTLYHQTSHSAGKSILKHGFRAGHVGWCGAGIYFAMSAAATSQKIKGPDSHGGYMIEAKVDVGRVKHMPWHCTTSPSCNHHPFAKCQDRTNRGSWLHRQGYDSINFQPDPYGQEYVIFDKSRVVSMRGYSYHR